MENGVINFATMRSTGTSNKTLTDTQIRDSIRLQLQKQIDELKAKGGQ